MRLHLLTFTDSKHQITKYIIKSSTNHLRIQLIINNESYKFNKLLKNSSKQKLNKSVSNHLLIKYKVYLNLITFMQIIDVVIEDINVL